ncbi:MAG TPA: hypothetical protein VLF67_03490 [Candidatus Saccharimonas sp.]|nr:hypothetical protein [Candidatus Saccharimonas sp.]
MAHTVKYDWAIPAGTASVPSADSRAKLFAVCVGDHPDESPGYTRVSFHFRGAAPPANFGYVASVSVGGKPTVLPLEGNAALRVQFTYVDPSIGNFPLGYHVGYRNLISWGCGAWFEGEVTCGLGLKVAPASDQRLAVRVGEQVEDPDGQGSNLDYILAFDVQYG